MKNRLHPLECDSVSTLETDRKFSRKIDGNFSRSKSNKSESKSLSKFFVKNLQHNTKVAQMQQKLSKSINRQSEIGSPQTLKMGIIENQKVREKYLNKNTVHQQKLKKQVERLCYQLEKYKTQLKSQKQNVKNLQQYNKSLCEKIINLETTTKELEQVCTQIKGQVDDLRKSLEEKQKLIEYFRQEQPSFKRIKSSIFQMRIQQLEREKMMLINKLNEYEKKLGAEAKDMIETKIQEKINQTQLIVRLQTQLYNTKEQIKKVRIAENCMKRKHHNQMKQYKEKKEKQYEQLRNKFNEFLLKYKESMKKMATFQVQSLIHNQMKANEKKSDPQQSNNCRIQFSVVPLNKKYNLIKAREKDKQSEGLQSQVSFSLSQQQEF